MIFADKCNLGGGAVSYNKQGNNTYMQEFGGQRGEGAYFQENRVLLRHFFNRRTGNKEISNSVYGQWHQFNTLTFSE